MTGPMTGPDWEQEFARWLRPFLEALGHKARRRCAPVYAVVMQRPGPPGCRRVGPAPDD
jgi:hypothetical protein